MLEISECLYFALICSGTPETAEVIVQSLDKVNKSINFVVRSGDLLKQYNSFQAKLHVVPSSQGGSVVKWNVEFEKVDENDPNPEHHVNFALKISEGLDAYLSRLNMHASIYIYIST